MRWRGRRASSNVEDRRGGRRPAGRSRAGRAGGLGLGAILLVVVLAFLTGEDPLSLLGAIAGEGGGGPGVGTGVGASLEPPLERGGVRTNDEQAQFVAVVLAETEDTWNRRLPALGTSYREPTLVLFTDQVRSACGFQSAAVGPFYCPGDQQVYLDFSFFSELERRFGAPGDFAQAYVIAHEVGHHVQNLLGISDEVRRLQSRGSREQANAVSVRLELQADCLAGVWAHDAGRSDMLESGDLEEGLRAAAAIGDDTLQRRAQGYVVPESFTHGSSEQRQKWFLQGLRSGDPDLCETFAGEI